MYTTGRLNPALCSAFYGHFEPIYQIRLNGDSLLFVDLLTLY